MTRCRSDSAPPSDFVPFSTMKPILPVTLLLLATSNQAVHAQQAMSAAMTISASGTRPSFEGSARNFTGVVRVDPMKQAEAPSKVSVGSVRFEPGARSAWHTHPLGQTLVVTSGVGWTQEWNGRKHEIRAGDVVWCPPGVKHWHGATATTDMTHIAIQEALNGNNVEWLEQVSDEQYGS